MRGPKCAGVAYKKHNPDTVLKVQKSEQRATKGKGNKKTSGVPKDPAAPKRPSGAFFIFMEDFRKSFKENFPDNKGVSAVGKAGGEKWKSMSAIEKAPFLDKALTKKADYEKALEAYKMKANAGGEKPDESEKSTSEVHDDTEQEASS